MPRRTILLIEDIPKLEISAVHIEPARPFQVTLELIHRTLRKKVGRILVSYHGYVGPICDFVSYTDFGFSTAMKDLLSVTMPGMAGQILNVGWETFNTLNGQSRLR